MIRKLSIDIPHAAIADFCRRWKVLEFSLFGSALEDRFHSESDVDVLVDFEHDAEWDLLDAEEMESELAELFHRRVDLVTRRAIEMSTNPIRREAILRSAVPIYAA